MVSNADESVAGIIWSHILGLFTNMNLLIGIGIFLFLLLAASHIIWFSERRHNPQFPKSYLAGIWESFWWAVVTVTTVGYGDKTPRGKLGRVFGIMWILAGYFVFAYFTASVTSSVTLRELHGTINGPEDLMNRRVATVRRSTAAEYLTARGIRPVLFDGIESAYPALEAGKVDAVVYDAPVLQHYASHAGNGIVKVTGLIFEEQAYGIALQAGSPHREEINLALLKLMENGTYRRIFEKWFG